MAENSLSKPLYLVGYILWLTCMTSYAVLFRSNAKGLCATVTCSAGLVFFHLSHGIVPTVFQAKDGIMTHFAVIIIQSKMIRVTKNH